MVLDMSRFGLLERVRPTRLRQRNRRPRISYDATAREQLAGAARTRFHVATRMVEAPGLRSAVVAWIARFGAPVLLLGSVWNRSECSVDGLNRKLDTSPDHQHVVSAHLADRAHRTNSGAGRGSCRGTVTELAQAGAYSATTSRR